MIGERLGKSRPRGDPGTDRGGRSRKVDQRRTGGAGRQKNFQRVLKDVRAEAIRLHTEGTVLIYRKGKPVEDPKAFKGVYRLGRPAVS